MTLETERPTAQREERGSARRKGRGAPFYIGLGLLLTGLGLLGYVGWQIYGTNIVSRHAQQEVVADLHKEWSRPAAVEGDGREGDGREDSKQATAGAKLGEASALIRIPKFGNDYVVPVLEGLSDEVLAKGYGHFPASAEPGQQGNYALAAHRITHGEPLRDMPKLRPGDEVIVETRTAIYTYELDTNPNDLIVTFEDIWVVNPLPTNPDPNGVQPTQMSGQRLITLTTCAELFYTDERMIAFGHLSQTQRK